MATAAHQDSETLYGFSRSFDIGNADAAVSQSSTRVVNRPNPVDWIGEFRVRIIRSSSTAYDSAFGDHVNRHERRLQQCYEGVERTFR